jgi:phosphoketolase
VADHCLRSRDHVNLIVADKQEHLQYLDIEDAAAHCAAGASTWDWAGTGTADEEPKEARPPARHGDAMLARHRGYIRERCEDMPEIRCWTWAR